jgi:hypothetical protein
VFKKLALAGATIVMSAAAVIPATPAAAQRYERHYGGDRYGDRYRGSYRQDYRGYDRRYDRRDYRHSYRSRCDNGDGGTLIGAIAGGLLGHSIAGRGDRTVGTVLGAGAGALAGRAIDRSSNPDYCRR